MSLREPTSNRPRGWSSDTISSIEDCVVFPGNGGRPPIREPHNAPTDPLAQTDLGFARFLKKHASPTHQRVTAGGRIVPMEKRQAPQFTLKNGTSPRKDLGSNYRGKEMGSAADTTMADPNVADARGSDLVNHQVPAANDNASKGNSSIVGASGLEFATNGMPDMGYGIGPIPFSPLMQPATYTPSLATDQIGMSQSPMPFPCAMPMIAPVPTYPYQYSMLPFANSIWSFPDLYLTPPQQASLNTTIDLQQLLSQAEAEFQELDRQLKELDRDRAMNNFDRTRAAQRFEIVDQRARAHENARRLRGALDMETGPNRTDTSQCSGRQLNVEADAWVPNIAVRGNQSVRIQKPADAETKTVPSKEPTSKPKTTASTSHFDPFVAIAPPDSPDLEGVDEWGVRLGRAPPELERQQSEMLESMTSERSSSPTSSAVEDENMAVAEPSASDQAKFQEKDEFDSNDGASDTDSETARPARAPPVVEQDYALHLDAMRKPMGITTHVRTHEGQVFIVSGQALERPASANMTEFERKYWSQSGEVDRDDSKANLQDQENSTAGVENTRGWTSEVDHIEVSHGSRIYTSKNGNHQKALIDIFKGSTNESRGNRSQNSGKDALIENMSGMVPQDPIDVLKGVSSGLSQNPARDAEVNFQDANGNKGYSSVAVQNIHALSRLPHGLDGAIDKIQKVASASKVKSPRVVHRATPTGNAWYGPFRREILEQIEKGESSAKALQGAYS